MGDFSSGPRSAVALFDNQAFKGHVVHPFRGSSHGPYDGARRMQSATPLFAWRSAWPTRNSSWVIKRLRDLVESAGLNATSYAATELAEAGVSDSVGLVGLGEPTIIPSPLCLFRMGSQNDHQPVSSSGPLYIRRQDSGWVTLLQFCLPILSEVR
jgi:hypothetical protein